MEPIYSDMIRALTAMGGRASNASLRQRMDVEADTYVQIKEAALADKVIKLARGRGGFVVLTEGYGEI